MEPPVVEVRNLSKDFVSSRPLHRLLLAPFGRGRRIHALRDVSFGVAGGEILGVVGPNGAGKTTLMRVIADLLEADRGSVHFCGRDLASLGHRARGHIGYVSNDERSFFWRLTGAQNLEFFGCLYGLSRAEARRRMGELLERFALREQAGHLFRDYSSGTRKKFALVRALIHRPRLLLLDEVTNSLDPPSAHHVKSMVRDYVCSCNDCAGIWSTHRLEEIGEICDRVLVISRGRAEFLGSAHERTTTGDSDGRNAPFENGLRKELRRSSVTPEGIHRMLGRGIERQPSLME
jgi:ABC-2 type transport system ATP-binding protein